ncbi:MAG TPA: glucans biosynthesis glucosyltransferase MdoH [Candidatus Binatia bacterium]
MTTNGGAVADAPSGPGPATIRELNRHTRQWGKAERRQRLVQSDLNSVRENIHAWAMPEIKRLSMLPNRMERNPLVTLWRALRGRTRNNDIERTGPASTKAALAGWRGAAASRRRVLIALIIIQTAIATWSLGNTFPYPWLKASEIAILVLFAILFSWISLGFWSAVAGFWVVWKRKNEFTGADLPVDDRQPLRSRTAVLMPICNEDVIRVFAGLEASYRSLAETSQFASFDFFVLSDTGDPERQAEEEIAWAQLCAAVQGFGRIFYRHRRNNVRRKSGNIADFLRRWGRDYDYMVVFDADSIMAGETVVRLAQMMEQYPQAGIIQTAPTTVNCDSLFGRLQQFASRAYGPVLTAGQRFWQLGDGYYWGHNAIIRTAPFIKHCGLARLPGRAPLGGEILSHDFVEAALMGRAGWEVWVVHDLGGSYEESPPTLSDELKRDRRWCQGNLQHLRLLLADGIRAGHRSILAMGVMAYASALLWFVFLILNTVELAAQTVLPLVYFTSEPSLFPLWPRWHPEWAVALLTTTAVLLFLPKILSLLVIVKNRQTHLFGGFLPLCVSICLEIIVSTLLAPIRMWFHSQFVVVTLMGRQIKWGPQFRTDNETRWRDATRLHGIATLLAFGWVFGMFWLNPAVSVWLLPVGISLLLAVPLSVFSSRLSLGRLMRQWRLFLIPEEIRSPQVINYLHASLIKRRENRQRDGFVQAVVDPYANAVHLGLLRGKKPQTSEAIDRNRNLRELALRNGPAILSRADKTRLLRDSETMALLHRQVWRVRDTNLANQWGLSELQ